MTKRIILAAALLALTSATAPPQSVVPAQAPARARSAAEWAALAKLPDWSGTWQPDVSDQDRQVKSNPTPWTARAAALAAQQAAEEKSGKPFGLFLTCLPYGMPALMMLSHNAIEFTFEPNRVLLLGDGDGNRLRRVHTDGRSHPTVPDPSFFGDAVGRWEGDALVVDTIGVLPETYIPMSEAVGVPNNGGMHIVERIHLVAGDPDTLADDLTITAPKVLTRPWQTTRLFHRDRTPAAEIGEGACLQGKFSEEIDADGNAIFVPRQFDQYGAPVPGK